jgi:calmodulin
MTSKSNRVNNESLRQNLTREMLVEVEETYYAVSEATGVLPIAKLPLALKALGMSLNEAELKIEVDSIDFDKFLEVVLICMKHPNWAANEMSESYALFDKDDVGNIGPNELRALFARLGENLLQTELEDQLREFDVDGDLLVRLSSI